MLNKKRTNSPLRMGAIAALALSISFSAPVAAKTGSLQINHALETDSAKTVQLSASKENSAKLTISKKTWKKTLKTNKGKTYMTFKYQYPVFEGDSAAAKKLNTFYKNAKKKWYASDKENRKEAKELWTTGENQPFRAFSDNVICDVTCNGDYVSILQLGCIDLVGAHPTGYYINHTFSAKTGNEVTAMKILGKTKAEINKQVRSEFKKLYKKNPSAFYDKKDFLDGLKTDFTGKKMYYLYEKNGKKNLVFYADEYLLAPHAAGIIEVKLPVR